MASTKTSEKTARKKALKALKEAEKARKQEEEMKNLKVVSLETNLLYALTDVCDLFVQDLLQRMPGVGMTFGMGKRIQFQTYKNTLRTASDIFEQFFVQDEIDATEGRIDEFDHRRADANEMARLILLYAEKTARSEKNMVSVFEHLISLEDSSGIVTDDLLSDFSFNG